MIGEEIFASDLSCILPLPGFTRDGAGVTILPNTGYLPGKYPVIWWVTFG